VVIAFLVFDGITLLDAIGPYEVLGALPGAEVKFVAQEKGMKRTEDGATSIEARYDFAEVPAADVLLVPGGVGTRKMVQDEATLEWVRAIHVGSTFTTSVCTGSLVLAAAGILDGLNATGHWLYLEPLGAFGANPTRERVVEDGKVVTAAGVSSGIDMALTLAERIAGPEVAQSIQLAIEYDPQPPFDAGSPAKAPAGVVEAVRKLAAQWDARAAADS
jgi:transcriptional regulator GlxA family with amidase domain